MQELSKRATHWFKTFPNTVTTKMSEKITNETVLKSMGMLEAARKQKD